MFRCKKCKCESAPTGSLNFTQVQVGKDTFEAAPTFKYLGDVIGESDDCVDATSARITTDGQVLDNNYQSLPIVVFH